MLASLTLVVALLSAELLSPLPDVHAAPLPPDTATSAPEIAQIPPNFTENVHQHSRPKRIIIPHLSINSPVIEVGLNALGEIDVPDGKTNAVGWYRYGTLPGERGSAVLDAHVYAAFKNLRHAEIGEHIVIENEHGVAHVFRITQSRVYPVAETPMEELVFDTSGTYINLITCEGTFSLRTGTYDKRRVVTAELVL